MEKFIKKFKEARLLHKIVYFLPLISSVISIFCIVWLYFGLTGELYDMYHRKNITFVFYIVWGILTIFMLFGLIESNHGELPSIEEFITKNFKEALVNTIMLPIGIFIFFGLSLIFVSMIPYLIVEYWSISKVILLILLVSLIFLGIYIFVTSSNEDTIIRYIIGTILLGIFVIYPFSRSDTYNQFMAEYYLKGKDYKEAIDYLKFIALESDNDYLREKSANLVINLYLKDDNKWEAVEFAHEVDDISDYANYIIGINELESENLTLATYYLYKASDSYAYKDTYNELQEAIKERGRQILHDIFIPDDIFDLIPTKKIFKGAKILKMISKGSKIGQKIYKKHMIKSINSSKEQIKKFEQCIKHNSYEECKYKLPS